MPPPARDKILAEIFTSLSLPLPVPAHTVLPDPRPLPFPSSYNLPLLITSTTLLSTLIPALLLSHRNSLASTPKTTVHPLHAAAQFISERLYTVDSRPPAEDPSRVGGLHPTGGGGHVRIHDGFPNHKLGALRLLGLPDTASREDVSRACLAWPSSAALESAAHEAGLPIYALRTPGEWAAHPQSAHTSSSPILLSPLASSAATGSPFPLPPTLAPHRCLSGVRILDLSRVIAAPSAGKLLASHGADVIWVTSPDLPSLPTLDVEFSRGKRSVQLDLASSDADRETLRSLARTCDVFLQSYRPGSLAAKGFSAEALAELNPHVVYANLSAFGPEGPWSGRRGFDSLVQTCTGMNHSEAEASPVPDDGERPPALPLPCQALDHASGQLLAAGICAALYNRSVKGGAWKVDVSLAGTQKFLEGMGRVEDGFACGKVTGQESFPAEVFEEGDLEDGLGRMKFVSAAGRIEGVEVGWERMPGKMGRDRAEWLPRPEAWSCP